MNKNTLNYQWSSNIVSILINLGIRDFCISPGARNTPIIYDIVRRKKLFCISVHDERNCGYFSLGISKLTNKPTVIVTTSGTAVANLLPSIVEAYYSMTPLIILTADRPSELIGTGSNQTINQTSIFGSFVKLNINLDNPSTLKVDSLINVISEDIIQVNGPVHINIPLFEPSIPPLYKESTIHYKDRPNRTIISNKSFQSLSINSKCIIVVGPLVHSKVQQKIVELADTIGAVIFADPLSNIVNDKDRDFILPSYELLLDLIDINPNIVIRFGTKPISKILNKKLEQWKSMTHLVQATPRFNDDANNIIECDPIVFCENLIIKNKKYIKKWYTQLVRSQRLISDVIYKKNKFSIPCFVRNTQESMDRDGLLFLGNSSIVRDFVRYGDNKKTNYISIGNRGASGIDGVLSTALGAASHGKGKNILVIGDMSFLYDLNALQVTTECDINLVIVVINNRGGQIFNRLDLSSINKASFDRYWKTSHNKKFEDIARFHGVGYKQIDHISEYSAAIRKNLDEGGINIIELTLDDKMVSRYNDSLEKDIASLF